MNLYIRIAIDTDKTPLNIGLDCGNRDVIVTWQVNCDWLAGHADRVDIAMLPGWKQA